MKLDRNLHLTFVLGGKAIFTVKNEQTGNRFTYKVQRARDSRYDNGPFFVSYLNGPDNYSNYQYLGVIWGTEYKHGAKSKVTKDAQSNKVFEWIFPRLVQNTLPSFIEIYHEGRCGCCGRKLTVPESIQLGFGPECAGRIGKFQRV